MEAVNHRRKAPTAQRDRSYDTLVLDMPMPQLDGFSTATLIGRSPGLRAIPVSAPAARVLPSDRERVLTAGHSEHMPNRANSQELVATIARLVREP